MREGGARSRNQDGCVGRNQTFNLAVASSLARKADVVAISK